MNNSHNKIYLFVHIIWSIGKPELSLTKPIRFVLFAYIQKYAAEKGIKMLIINGVEDHVHCLLQLHPAQNLAQVVKQLRTESAQWINDSKLIQGSFEWQEEYAAYSISPSSVKQVVEYISRQEEHHKTKTLESELDIFEKIQF